jgi:uncharacterized membrane protein YgdD (TMEM256/DUF423 family)
MGALSTPSSHFTMQERHIAACGALNMLIAIACGAFGAHALKKLLSPDMLAIWHTAVQYQMAHALGMLLIAALTPRLLSTAALSRIGIAFLFGIVVFSGSLYVLALTGVRWLGAITPVGGVAFLLGWGLLVWQILKQKEPRKY